MNMAEIYAKQTNEFGGVKGKSYAIFLEGHNVPLGVVSNFTHFSPPSLRGDVEELVRGGASLSKEAASLLARATVAALHF